ncbi:MAG: acyl-CoA hydrolase [Planctomycetaceae bacterium]|jgi:acyl-CoA thioesterase YciA|nr:acyl-CoA hydrolase [Planctomycetaceae bacterium]MBT6919084.1 acyl-CoA hydrolase [Planctomycetaceae bacterium]MBT7729980.1 acyl-CoA hydrolase [Planctomycetaceae bacterium]
MSETYEIATHRLILPADANHFGTLYAGSLLKYGLEAAYAAATHGVGNEANLMLRRVLSVECRRAVPVGTLVEIKGAILQVRQCHIVVGVVGMPLAASDLPWMDGLFGFVQVDKKGLPAELPETIQTASKKVFWKPLLNRLAETKTRGATAEWIAAGTEQS